MPVSEVDYNQPMIIEKYNKSDIGGPKMFEGMKTPSLKDMEKKDVPVKADHVKRITANDKLLGLT